MALEEASDAGDRAAGADAGDEGPNPSTALLEDFRPRGLLVYADIRGIGELIGQEPAVLRGQPPGHVLEVVRIMGRRVGRDDDPRPKRGQGIALVLRHLLRHDADERVTALSG